MKRKKTISFVLVLFAAMLMSFTGSVLAAPGKAKADKQPVINAGYPSKEVYTAKVTAPGGLKIKKSMNVTDDSGVTVPNGKIVSILSRESDNWYKISYGKDTGYVKGIMLVDNTDVMYTTANLNLRSEESRAVLLTMPEGSMVEVIERETDGWILVNYKGKVGYASSDYLSKDKPKQDPDKKDDKKKDDKKKDDKKKDNKKKEEPAKTIDLKNVKFENVYVYYDGKEHALPKVAGLPKDVKVNYNTSEKHRNIGEYSVTAEFSAVKKKDKLKNAEKKTAKLIIRVRKGAVYANKLYKVRITDPRTNGKGTAAVIGPVNKKISELRVARTIKIGGVRFRITVIGTKAFAGCRKLKSVILSDYIDTIGKKAFADCVRLEEITIGRGLKTLKSSAFSGDKRLKNIRFKSLKLKTVGKKVFKGIHKKAVIRVPKKKLKKYTKLFTKKGQGKDVVIK